MVLQRMDAPEWCISPAPGEVTPRLGVDDEPGREATDGKECSNGVDVWESALVDAGLLLLVRVPLDVHQRLRRHPAAGPVGLGKGRLDQPDRGPAIPRNPDLPDRHAEATGAEPVAQAPRAVIGGIAVSRRDRITKELLVEPGTEANVAGRDPAWTGGPEFEQLSERQLSHTAKALLADGVKELSEAQHLLWASDTYALLVVFQALDAAGKDSTIKHVMSGVNPQGVQVVSFKQPSSEELDHDFLWRTSMVAAILVDTIGSLDLSWPEVSDQARAANAEARRQLAAEPEDETG